MPLALRSQPDSQPPPTVFQMQWFNSVSELPIETKFLHDFQLQDTFLSLIKIREKIQKQINESLHQLHNDV